MKTAIVNTKDWNISECMSAVRFMQYNADDFKDIKISNKGIIAVKHEDVKHKCRNILNCTVAKCNLKKGILDNKHMIVENIKKEKLEEVIKSIEEIEKQMNAIIKTMK